MSSRSLEGASSRQGLRSPEGDRQLMSRSHKEVLRTHRGEITENMYPDEVLNILLGKVILTQKDVSRIKEKGAVDNQNEHMLDLLMRKPDRAFREFMSALCQTEQGHVAELLEPDLVTGENETASSSSARHLRKDTASRKGGGDHASAVSDDEYLSPPSTPRKRKAQTVGVRLNVTGVEHDEDADEEDDILTPQRKRPNRRATLSEPMPRDEALTARLNEELLEAYILETRNLKEVLRAPITQQTMNQRKVIMETLNFLNKQRRELQGVFEGSVVLCLFCPTLNSLQSLWLSCVDGILQSLFDAAVNSDCLGLRRRHRLRRISIEVTMSSKEYELCTQEIQSVLSNDKENSNSSSNSENSPDVVRKIPKSVLNIGQEEDDTAREKCIPLRERKDHHQCYAGSHSSSKYRTPSPWSSSDNVSYGDSQDSTIHALSAEAARGLRFDTCS